MKMMPLIKTIPLFLVTILLGACVSDTASVEEQKNNVIEANKVFMATFSRADAAAMSDLYTTDGSLMPTNSDFVKGRKGIKSVWQSVFDAGIKEVNLETLEVEGAGDTLYEVGKYTLLVDGGNVADAGKYIVIWKKEEGQWKLHYDIFNTSLPAAGQ